MKGFVYFVAMGDYSEETWIKIGFTSGNVYARRNALQTGCPYALDVLAYAPGTIEDEAELHRRFAAFRGFGEWFCLEGSLQAYVSDLIRQSEPRKPASTLWTDVYRQEMIR